MLTKTICVKAGDDDPDRPYGLAWRGRMTGYLIILAAGTLTSWLYWAAFTWLGGL